ncbi:hypothetical protein ACWF94_19365 [Streptomyces sp. NPDC055078]
MTTTGDGTARKDLTISVYRVDPKTLDRTPVKSCVLPPAEVPMMSQAYPPCRCTRCTDR